MIISFVVCPTSASLIFRYIGRPGSHHLPRTTGRLRISTKGLKAVPPDSSLLTT